MDKDNLLQQLQETLRKIQKTEDLEFIENVRRNILKNAIFAGVTDTTTSGIITTVDASTLGTFVVAKRPDVRALVNIDGTDYYLGLYHT